MNENELIVYQTFKLLIIVLILCVIHVNWHSLFMFLLIGRNMLICDSCLILHIIKRVIKTIFEILPILLIYKMLIDSQRRIIL